MRLKRTSITIVGVVVAVMAVMVTSASTTNPVRVFIAGDSIASTCTIAEAPRAGWGQVLPAFLTPGVETVNEALGGASTKSFADEGHLDRILARIQRGDYLLISFGHNDQKKDDPARHTEPSTTYQSYLAQYIDRSRAKGATPVLLTSVARRRFDSSGAIIPTHGTYPAAMRELAAAKGVPLIDLTTSSTALFNNVGVEGTKKHFLHLAPGQHPDHPDGAEDNTHLQAAGAIEIARLVATGLHDQGVLPPGWFRQLDAQLTPDEIGWPS